MSPAETAHVEGETPNEHHNDPTRTRRTSASPSPSLRTPLFRACFGRSSDSLPPLPTLRTPFVVVAGDPSSEDREGVAKSCFSRTTITSTSIMAEALPPTPRILVEGPQQQRRSSSSSFDRSQYQGVLWKRRDVFKNRWRPRWFVLQPGQGILTYYLLTGDGVANTPAPLDSTDAPGSLEESPFAALVSDEDMRPSRDRATSWDSRASDNPVHYDVVPRGTIYLLGCNVKVNPSLSKPSEHLFALTIIPPSTTEPHIHLAAQTPELRDRWIRSIAAICRCDDTDNNGDEGTEDLIVASPPSSTTRDRRRATSSSPSPASTARPLHPTTIPEHAPLVAASPPRRGAPTRAASLPATPRSRANASPRAPYSHSTSSSLLPGPPSLATSAAAQRSTPRAQSTEPPALPAAWQSHGPTNVLYENLPATLVGRLQDALHTALREVGDSTDTAPPDPTIYKVLYQHEGTTAYRRRRSALDRPASSAYVKVVSTLPQSARQVFEALVDPARTCDAERGRLLDCGRIQALNAHTFVDYVAYPGVWPAPPRDFVVATHWQVVVGHEHENGSEVRKAIVLISLSCPEADRVWESHSELAAPATSGSSPARPPTSRSTKRVRGTVHLCANLIQPLPVAPGGGDDSASPANQCKWTRLLSIDLGGGEEATPQLVNAVLHQRAKFPLRLGAYLRQYGPTPEPRHRGPLTNESLYRSIVGKLEETRRSVVRDKRRRDSQHETPRDSLVIPEDEASTDGGAIENPDFLLPPLDQQALVLLAPLLLYQFLVLVKAPSPALGFLASVFWAVRQVVLLHIGPTLPDAGPTLVGPVTCRFRIDLKGVLRFIANKKEEREELKRGTADITVLHIVACAVATALRKCDALQVRQVSIPWLGIHRTVSRGAADPVSVSFLVNSETGSHIITLQHVDTYNVQRVADEMKAAADHPDAGSASVGQCLIVAAPNYDHTEMETDVVPRHPKVQVVCTVGGVHLDRNAPPLARSGGAVRSPGPRPFLSLSLTVANTSYTDYNACTRLAEDVQTLLQFPEMCDD